MAEDEVAKEMVVRPGADTALQLHLCRLWNSSGAHAALSSSFVAMTGWRGALASPSSPGPDRLAR